jgi:hypothetical protein
MTNRIALAILVLAFGSGKADFAFEDEEVTKHGADEGVELRQLRMAVDNEEVMADGEVEAEAAAEGHVTWWTELPKNCYKGYGAGYVGGPHTSWVQGKTLDQCKAMCLEKSGCTAITFDFSANKYCWFRKAAPGHAAIVKSACRPSSQYHTFFPPTWTELPKNCYKGYGAGYVGGPHTSWVQGKTLDQCKAMCLVKSGCTAITFDSSATRYCWFRKPAPGHGAIVKSACKPSGKYHTFFPKASLLETDGQELNAEADEEVQDEVAEEEATEMSTAEEEEAAEEATETAGPSCKGSVHRTSLTNCWNAHGNCDQWYESSKKVCAIDRGASKATNPYYVPIGGQWWCKPETNAYTSTPPGKHRTNLGNRNCLTVHGGSCDIYYETSTKVCVPDRNTKKKPIPGQWWCKPSTEVCH